MATYFPDLLAEYKELLKQMKSEGITSGSMYTEVKQAIEWMETGYDPAERRAAIRIDAYPVDPYHMQTYMAYVNDDEMLMPEYLMPIKDDIDARLVALGTDYEKEASFVERMMLPVTNAATKAAARKEEIAGALQGLTDNERAAFILVRAERYTYAHAAKLLGVHKSSVQVYVRRAEQKIWNNTKEENNIVATA